jgi:hypothetical protein
MDDLFFYRSAHLSDLSAPASRILDIQEAGGRIAWFEDGPWDPWNHTECAMALTVMGALDAARLAFDHLAETQRADGAWFGEYGNALPMVERDYISREPAPAFLDTNFCAYPAVGVLHYLLATDDLGRVRDWWPMVRGAMDFVTALQRADGTISWAFEAVGTDDDDALLAGNASVAKSLECAIALAARLGEDASAWIAAREALVAALRTSPELFDRKGGGRRFAMDWYYPVLSGALDPPTAAKRLQSQTATFVDPVRGCRCVSDEPWVTVAETCELAMAYLSVDQGAEAASLLEAISSHCDVDGVFWMGWQYEEETVWPKETPSWTQAAVILAIDALHGDYAHSRLLTRSIL